MSSPEKSAEPAPSPAPLAPAGESPEPPPAFAGAMPRAPPLARRIWPVIVGIVVLIVIVGILALTLIGSGGSGNGTAPTYSAASRAANQVAAGVSGGPWNFVVAAGIDLSASTSATANGTVGSGCTYSSPGGGPAPTSVFVPRFGGSFSSGGSPWWGMIYFQPTSHDVLLVEVVNGSAQAALIASGSCTNTFQNYTTIPTNVVDSSTVASAVWNSGGSSFLSAHSNESFNQVLGLLGGGTSCVLTSGPCWLVEYTPCNPIGGSNPTGSQPVFYALVDGTTGTIITDLPSSSTCTSSGVTLATGGLGQSLGARPLWGP